MEGAGKRGRVIPSLEQRCLSDVSFPAERPSIPKGAAVPDDRHHLFFHEDGVPRPLSANPYENRHDRADQRGGVSPARNPEDPEALRHSHARSDATGARAVCEQATGVAGALPEPRSRAVRGSRMHDPRRNLSGNRRREDALLRGRPAERSNHPRAARDDLRGNQWAASRVGCRDPGGLRPTGDGQAGARNAGSRTERDGGPPA